MHKEVSKGEMTFRQTRYVCDRCGRIASKMSIVHLSAPADSLYQGKYQIVHLCPKCREELSDRIVPIGKTSIIKKGKDREDEI